MHVSQPSRIGVFRLYHGICNLEMSSGSLNPAIVPPQLVVEIVPFCCCLRAWDFERGILLISVWTISIGSKLGFMFQEKGNVKRGYRSLKKSVMRSLHICKAAGRPASPLHCLYATGRPFVLLDHILQSR